jgi:hypothetical protein
MRRWLDRPGYVGVISFAGGAALAGVIVLVIVFALGGDGDDDGAGLQVAATSTPDPLAGANPTAGGTPGAGAATATPGSGQDPDEALETFIEDVLESEHLGDCPEELPEGEAPPTGICSLELYRSAELATFLLGVPFGEGIGEAVITANEDGSWSVNFVQSGPLGETVAVGSQAVVYGAGSCLRFREEPSLSAEVVSCQIDGREGQVVEGPEDADDHTWWRLDGLGWASEEFLMPAAGD